MYKIPSSAASRNVSKSKFQGLISVALIPRKDALSSVGEYSSKCFSPFLVKEGDGKGENSLS